MRVFVDTSGFYAFLNRSDPFHQESVGYFERAEAEGWSLITSNYVVHESWALIQARLGWDAVEAWLTTLVPRCEVVWVNESLFLSGSARARQARERRLSLTDCISFEVMLANRIQSYIGDDAHFGSQGFHRPGKAERLSKKC
jgi:predicted nucleic acid-binding protein